MITRHMNITDNSGRVYCHRKADLVKADAKHMDNWCSQCPYYAGTIVGSGVECDYDDGSNKDTVYFEDAVESERYNLQQQVKMGAITQEEADDRMKGYDEKQTEVMTPAEEAATDKIDAVRTGGEAPPPDLSVEETNGS